MEIIGKGRIGYPIHAVSQTLDKDAIQACAGQIGNVLGYVSLNEDEAGTNSSVFSCDGPFLSVLYPGGLTGLVCIHELEMIPD